MADPRILWGSINTAGKVEHGSGGFTPSRQDEGTFVISFSPTFAGLPAMVATLTKFGSTDQSPNDGIVIPLLSSSSATVLTGDNHNNLADRSFSFIAIGKSSS
jgi:hypothetical protein